MNGVFEHTHAVLTFRRKRYGKETCVCERERKREKSTTYKYSMRSLSKHTLAYD